MKTLYKYLKENNGILKCPFCGEDIYKVDLPEESASATTSVKSRHFHTLKEGYSDPPPHSNMDCYLCHKSFVFVAGNRVLYYNDTKLEPKVER